MKAFLSASKAEWHSSDKCHEVPLRVRRMSRTVISDYLNETMVEIGKAEEGLNVLDFSWCWPILNDLNFVWGHGEAFR